MDILIQVDLRCLSYGQKDLLCYGRKQRREWRSLKSEMVRSAPLAFSPYTVGRQLELELELELF